MCVSSASRLLLLLDRHTAQETAGKMTRTGNNEKKRGKHRHNRWKVEKKSNVQRVNILSI